mgnify:CR=1 FL=1
MNEILEVLKSVKENVDYMNCDNLIDGKVLDSVELIDLVAKLEEVFDIEIDPEEIAPENFNSAKSLWGMIERLK